MEQTSSGNLNNILKEKGLLATFLEKIPLGAHVYVVEENDALVFVGANESADKVLGIQHQDLIGKKILEAFPLLKDTEIPSIYLQIAKDGGSRFIEQILYDDKESISGVFDVVAMQISKNQIVALFRDVTEQKKMGIALRQSQRKMMETIDNMADGLTVVRKGRIIQINKRALDIFGFDKVPTEGFTSIDFALESEKDKLRELQSRMKREGSTTAQIEFWIRSLRGEIKYIQNRYHKTDNDNFIIFTIDITEQKKAQEELLKKKEDLERFERLAVNREIKMIELKKEIADLKAEITELRKQQQT